MERDGVNYKYINNAEFLSLQESNQIKAYQKFVINGEDWYYGITKDNLEKNNLFIMTPFELEQLSSEERKNCFVVYLNIDEKVRRNRLIKRNDNSDSIDRRIEADRLDFENFKDYDLMLMDEEFEIDLVYQFAK